MAHRSPVPGTAVRIHGLSTPSLPIKSSGKSAGRWTPLVGEGKAWSRCVSQSWGVHVFSTLHWLPTASSCYFCYIILFIYLLLTQDHDPFFFLCVVRSMRMWASAARLSLKGWEHNRTSSINSTYCFEHIEYCLSCMSVRSSSELSCWPQSFRPTEQPSATLAPSCGAVYIEPLSSCLLVSKAKLKKFFKLIFFFAQ